MNSDHVLAAIAGALDAGDEISADAMRWAPEAPADQQPTAALHERHNSRTGTVYSGWVNLGYVSDDGAQFERVDPAVDTPHTATSVSMSHAPFTMDLTDAQRDVLYRVLLGWPPASDPDSLAAFRAIMNTAAAHRQTGDPDA